jgi:hypothetical protein
MRIYSDDQERTVRSQRLAREWMRSGLIDAGQHERIDAGLRLALRRTNRFLRVTLFGFGVLIIGALVGLLFVTFDVDDAEPAAALSLAVAAGCAALAECLIRRLRLYHFGIEEACAVASATLAAAAAGIFASSSSGNRPFFAALVVASVAAFAVYRRYGYVYAGVAAVACAGLAPFPLDLPIVDRMVSAAVLAGGFLAARRAYRRYGDEFPGDEYAIIQASAWVGVYASLNLHLFPLPAPRSYSSFYWLTFVMIWVLPIAGLWLSIRQRDRMMLDASLLLMFATLVTNKPYLGIARNPWDPIVLGVLLIGSAVATRRWLAGGPNDSRSGFTATRILRSEKDALAAAGVASAPFHVTPAVPHPEPAAADPFEGGRSGGGGGGATF